MRLQAQEFEVAMNAGGRNGRLRGDAAHAPMGGSVGGLGVKRLVDQVGHAFIVD